MTLEDIVETLGGLDEELTIYAAKPWKCDSPAVVAREPESGGLPPEAKEKGLDYFIEVSIAREFLEGWKQNQSKDTPIREQCERLVHYAVYDA